jgi:hypothetical protein
LVSLDETYEFKWQFIKKNFVDREAILKNFDNFISGKSDNLLLNIYGPGGLGKSHIIHQIREIILQENDLDNNIAFTYIDFVSNDISPISNFQTITRELERFGFEFHCFNFALHQYYIEKGNRRMAQEIADDHFSEYLEYREFTGEILDPIIQGLGGLLKDRKSVV